MKLPFMPSPFAIKPINIPAVAAAPVVQPPAQIVVPPVARKPAVARVKKAATPVKEVIAEPTVKILDVESPLTIDEAISYVYAKSVEQLAKETGQPKKIVKKRIDALWNKDYLEERNGYYRYQNTASWKTSK